MSLNPHANLVVAASVEVNLFLIKSGVQLQGSLSTAVIPTVEASCKAGTKVILHQF